MAAFDNHCGDMGENNISQPMSHNDSGFQWSAPSDMAKKPV